jgi:hypothetical protein
MLNGILTIQPSVPASDGFVVDPSKPVQAGTAKAIVVTAARIFRRLSMRVGSVIGLRFPLLRKAARKIFAKR